MSFSRQIVYKFPLYRFHDPKITLFVVSFRKLFLLAALRHISSTNYKKWLIENTPQNFRQNTCNFHSSASRSSETRSITKQNFIKWPFTKTRAVERCLGAKSSRDSSGIENDWFLETIMFLILVSYQTSRWMNKQKIIASQYSLHGKSGLLRHR